MSITSAQKEVLDELSKPDTKLLVQVSAGAREPLAAEAVRKVPRKYRWSSMTYESEERVRVRIASVRALEKEGFITRPARTDLERRYTNEQGERVLEEVWSVNTKALAAVEVKDDRDTVTRKVVKQLEGWKVVAKYPSSSSSSVHTVEYDGSTYRCTCQGFRIKKNGHCRHTDQASAEGLR